MSSGAKTVRRTLFARTDLPKIASLGVILARGGRETSACRKGVEACDKTTVISRKYSRFITSPVRHPP